MVVSLVKIHQMKLNNKPFNMIKNGRKNIELRLYDEKRRKLNYSLSAISIPTTPYCFCFSGV